MTAKKSSLRNVLACGHAICRNGRIHLDVRLARKAQVPKGWQKMNRQHNRRYLSRIEAAGYLGVSIRMFDQWAAERRIPVVRAGGRVLADLADLDGFYASLKQIT